MQVDAFALTYRQVEAFLLILTRVSVLFLVAPVFGNRNVPALVKAGASMLIALVILMAMPSLDGVTVSHSTFQLAGKVFSEFIVGLAIAYTSFLLFAGIQLAGQIVDIQMGFGLVNVIDPQSNTQVSIIGQFYYLMAILIFLAINGHHVLLRAVADSFNLVPPGSFSPLTSMAVTGPVIAQFFTRLFIIALQIAGPAIITLFLTTLAMGILSRTMPQMNIFIVGLPINVVVGLLITFLTLHVISGALTSVVSSMATSITKLLAAMAAG